MSFVVEFKNQEVKTFIDLLSSKVKRIKGAEKRYMGILSSIVFKDVLTHFKDQKGYSGPWAPWSKSYQEQMARKGRGGNKILQWSGKLRQNFQPNNWRKNSQGVFWFNNAETRSGFPYAWAHDEGSGRLPKRDFMYLSDKGLEEMTEKTLSFLLDEAK